MDRSHIPEKWNSSLAYAMGLLATDGSLSKDGRHVDLTSCDKEQLRTFMKCVGIEAKIGKKLSGDKERISYRVQISSVLFYKFLLSIGFTPNKTKTLGPIKVPKKYFFDFLRGHFDGDGYFYSYWDKRWSASFMYYVVFVSASENHIQWLRNTLRVLLGVEGSLRRSSSVYELRFAKREGILVLNEMYSNIRKNYLARKKLKIDRALSIVGERLPR